MKKYRISINGSDYLVEVEEIAGVQSATPRPAAVAPVPAKPPVSAPAAPASTQPATAGPTPTAKAAGPIPQGAETITAPMPGKILALKVKEGDTVQEGNLILILEAMKMENEIFCSCAGTVKEIRTTEGASVNPGEILVVIG